MNLYAIRHQRTRVDQLRERIECIQADLERITKTPRNLPVGSTPSDALSAKVAKLMDFKAQLAEEAVALETGIRAAEGTLKGLTETERRIIYLRYVDALDWDVIAPEVGYSVSHCFALHKQAIQKLNSK